MLRKLVGERNLAVTSKLSVNAFSWLSVSGLVALSLLLRILFYQHADLLVEEAYYWNYGQHLDFGYLDHPPMVGVLIRWSTELFGTNEWAVRLPALFCWLMTLYYMVLFMRRIAPAATRYALLLLAMLPFFFLQSLVTTPDEPLIACWSASLYYLYCALVRNEARAWLKLGVAGGIGLFSKYTLVVLAPAVLSYLFWVPSARHWLRRLEPYVGACIALFCFLPVVYWNAQHDWVSFAFQSARRFNEPGTFSLHMVAALLLFFLMPVGLISFVRLFNPNERLVTVFSDETRRFLQVFSAVPLVFFSLFSLTHPVKFNWIGPGLLAVVPWLAVTLQHANQSLRQQWRITLLLLAVIYSGMIAVLGFGLTFSLPKTLTRVALNKFIDWEHLTQQLVKVAKNEEKNTQTRPVFLPLDRYNIASEIAFYQAKMKARGALSEPYAVSGSHVFGDESLMYRYWSNPHTLVGKRLVLIADNPRLLQNPLIKQRTSNQSPVRSFWTLSQGAALPMRVFYYQLVTYESN